MADLLHESLVAAFDFEAFSDGHRDRRAKLAGDFLQSLSRHLQAVQEELHPDAFSTGDGVLVSVGRDLAINEDVAKRFLVFVIDLAAELCRAGVIVRVAVHYSQGDHIVFGTERVLPGQYLQVGDTINVAAQMLAFCEPREVMISGAVDDLLASHGLTSAFTFRRNDPLITKRGRRLITFTFDPSVELQDALYSPSSPVHPFKRFTAFPPLTAKTLHVFMDGGLDSEMKKVVSNAYDAMSQVNETKTFISASEVIAVLTRDNYDPDDTVYVVSRNDRPGFWTQKLGREYVAFLAANAARARGVINQTRVWVYEDSEEDDPDPDGPDSMFTDLWKLHAPRTLYRVNAGTLRNYDLLKQLIFGCTISKKHGYAIIPVPGADLDPRRLRPQDLGDLVLQYHDWEPGDGPMKAIITADESYVGALIAEFENILRVPQTKAFAGPRA